MQAEALSFDESEAELVDSNSNLSIEYSKISAAAANNTLLTESLGEEAEDEATPRRTVLADEECHKWVQNA